MNILFALVFLALLLLTSRARLLICKLPVLNFAAPRQKSNCCEYSCIVHVLNKDHIQLEGELNFDTVSKVLVEGKKLIQESKLLSIDLQRVTLSNSVGLALLIAL